MVKLHTRQSSVNLLRCLSNLSSNLISPLIYIRPDGTQGRLAACWPCDLYHRPLTYIYLQHVIMFMICWRQEVYRRGHKINIYGAPCTPTKSEVYVICHSDLLSRRVAVNVGLRTRSHRPRDSPGRHEKISLTDGVQSIARPPAERTAQ